MEKSSIYFKVILCTCLWLIGCFTCFGQWVQTNVPSSITVFSFTVRDSIVVVGTDSAVYISIDHGVNWTHPKNNGMQTAQVVSALAFTDSFLFAGGNPGGVFRSTDLGSSWQSVNVGLPSNQVYSFSVKDSIIFVGAYGGVFFSTNNELSWVPANSGITNPYVFTVLALSDTEGVPFILAGTVHLQGTSFMGGVYRSSNYGLNWQPVNNGLIDSSVWVLSLGITKNIYAATFGNGVFRTSDFGENWFAINNGLSNLKVTSLATRSGGTIDSSVFAGTFSGGGVFASTNCGTTWYPFGLTGKSVNALAINSKYLFAGLFGSTFTSGVWRRSLGNTLPVQDEESELPQEYLLEQNYPNPFNPTTNIRYALAHESRVSLKIYNIFGQQVQDLIDEVQSAGYKSLTFDANNLSSGVYFYQLQAGKFVDTKKLLFIK